MNKYSYTFSFNDVEVFIHYKVMKIWQGYKQLSSKKNEAFGVLIGYYNNENNIYIRMVTEPYSLDKATRTSFSLRDPKHQEIVSKAFQRSHSLLGYLGTWHTHPEHNPIPSSIDIGDWDRCILRNADRNLFFFIIGKDEPYLFYRKHNQYIKIKGKHHE